MAELGARHSGDDHAVRHQRRPRHRVAVFGVGRFRAPDLLAGLEVDRNHVRVKRGAVEFAVEHRGAAVDNAAAHNPRGVGGIFDDRFPNLFAGKGIKRDRLLMIREIDDAVLDQRLCLLAAIVGHAVGPGRHQPFDVIPIDECERAEAVLAVAHPIGEHVARGLFVVRELVRGLGERHHRECHAHKRGQQDGSH